MGVGGGVGGAGGGGRIPAIAACACSVIMRSLQTSSSMYGSLDIIHECTSCRLLKIGICASLLPGLVAVGFTSDNMGQCVFRYVWGTKYVRFAAGVTWLYIFIQRCSHVHVINGQAHARINHDTSSMCRATAILDTSIFDFGVLGRMLPPRREAPMRGASSRSTCVVCDCCSTTAVMQAPGATRVNKPSLAVLLGSISFALSLHTDDQCPQMT